MSGILGIIHVENGSPVHSETLNRMANTIRHRGPNLEGFYIRNGTGLGIRKLMIMGEESHPLPVHNENKTIWAIMDGRIYNYSELKRDLAARGHVFSGSSDTELLVHLYEEYAEGFPQHLRGMFALALWDDRERKLVLARDRLGKKPLAYRRHGKHLIFASEIKAILQHAGADREINHCALDQYLTYGYIISPLTMFKNIFKIPPGHILVFQNDSVNIRTYWDVSFHDDTAAPANHLRERLMELFTDAVRVRLNADIPLGVFLSGGVDSSLVVAVMSQLMNRPIKTFSIGFDEEDFSELRYARLVAERYGTEHHELIVKPDGILDLLPRLVWQFDEPFGDKSAVPTYYVSKLAREHVQVCLTGDGGDTVFAGHTTYLKAFHDLKCQKIPSPVRKLTGMLGSVLPVHLRRGESMRRFGMAPMEQFIRQGRFHDRLRECYYSKDLQKTLNGYDSYAIKRDLQKRVQTKQFLNQLQYIDLKTYLPDDILVKVDKTAMLCSVETRTPFLDQKLVDFMGAVPPELKLRGGTVKYILKDVFAHLLPEPILNRRKQGFSLPLTHWFKKKAFRNYAREILLSRQFNERGIFDAKGIRSLLEMSNPLYKPASLLLWSLLWLEIWYRLYMDSSPERL